MKGKKEFLGLGVSENEGAKFWLSVLTELKNRGVQDILIACVDGLKGFPETIAAKHPETRIQLCIVHMVRNSLKYVSWKDYKAFTVDLKPRKLFQSDDSALKVSTQPFRRRLKMDDAYSKLAYSVESLYD